MPPIRHIMVASDFSHDSHRAVTVAAELARPVSAKLTILHVVQPSSEATADIINDAKRWLAAAKGRLADLTVDTVCLDGDPATVILRWSEEHAPDLIVLGTHGRSGVRRLILGSVAERVLRAARCPTVTVRDQEPAAGAY